LRDRKREEERARYCRGRRGTRNVMRRALESRRRRGTGN